jgi:hypothetical protein
MGGLFGVSGVIVTTSNASNCRTNGRFRARGLWHGLRLRETAARWEDCCLERWMVAWWEDCCLYCDGLWHDGRIVAWSAMDGGMMGGLLSVCIVTVLRHDDCLA